MDRPLPGTSRRARLLGFCAACVLVLLALLGGSAGAAHAATVPNGFVGLNDWRMPSDQVMGTVSGMGVKRWRAGLFWYRIERQQGSFDWSEYDALVARAARNGVSLMLAIASCPAWACADEAGPPTSAAALAAHHDFVRQAVARYGNGGTFWAAHPELPYLPVTDWQVWNEVNSGAYWKPAPNAADYARFLRGEAAVIRATDPHATVVSSGLTNEGDVPLANFLHQLYAQPGFKESFDVMALHPYAGDSAAAIRLLDVAHQQATAAGDANRRMWVTEFGWGTPSPALPQLPSPEQQARLLRSTLDTMIGCRSRWHLERAYWFGYQDLDPPAGQADQPGYHTGLLDSAGRPKPAWAAMHDYSEGAPAPGAATCSLDVHRATVAPETAIVAPKRARRARIARLRLVASKRRSRFECSLMRIRRHRGRKSAAPRWRPCRKHYRTPRLRRGRYRLLVRAVDSQGHADRTPASARLALRGSRRLTLRVRVVRPTRG